jgi:FkbM family methyltransferase
MKTPKKGNVVFANGYNRVKLTRYGYMMYNPNDVFLGRSFDAYGEFSEAEVSFVRSCLTPQSIAMDIGANYGALTVPMARVASLVYAFEPQRPAYYALCASLAMNCMDNVVCENMALSDQVGFITVPRLDYAVENSIGSLELQQPGTFPHAAYDARTETLDGYVARNRIERLDFIKLDVEGMEETVLRGGEQAIRALRPVMYVEADRKEKVESLKRCIEALGYSWEDHKPPLFSPKNFFNNATNIWRDNYVSLNLVCRPL